MEGMDCGNLKISGEVTILTNLETGNYEISGAVSMSESSIFPQSIICELNVTLTSSSSTLSGTICKKNISVNLLDLMTLVSTSSICSI
jgi:hypothetical protein